MDAVQAANSGHPGTPMAMAPVVYTLWQRFLRFDPDDPIWPNRDRFVLSVGHASMLLYSLLHLTGVKAVNPQVRGARRAGGAARRHQAVPAARQPVPRAPGVPLDLRRRDDHGPARAGRGHQRRHGDRRQAGRPTHFNRPGFELFDYDVYALGGDGCMMEGVSQRGGVARRAPASSPTCAGSTTTTRSRSRATPTWRSARTWPRDSSRYGWNVTRVGDANDLQMLDARIHAFPGTTDRPTLIIVDSHIGYGAPTKQDTPPRTASRSATRKCV